MVLSAAKALVIPSPVPGNWSHCRAEPALALGEPQNPCKFGSGAGLEKEISSFSVALIGLLIFNLFLISFNKGFVLSQSKYSKLVNL